MNNKITIFLILPALFILFSCKEDRQGNYDAGHNMGALHISKERPQPGDTLILTYQWETETDEKNIEAFYHYFVGPFAYAQDLDLSEFSGEWKGKIIIPDSATAVTINISRNGIVDHNFKKGFVLSLYNEQGEVIPGSTASIGYFYYNPYGNYRQYNVVNNTGLVLIKKDLEQYPYLKKDWDDIYARLLNKIEAREYIEDRIQDYSKEILPDEKVLSNQVVFYNILNNKEKVDSLQQVITERFPLGKNVKEQLLKQFYQASDLSKKEELFKEYKEKFGQNETSHDKNYMLADWANFYAEKGDWGNFEKYSTQISDNLSKGFLYKDLASSLAKKGKDMEIAARLSKQALDIFYYPQNIEKAPTRTQKQHVKFIEFLRRQSADTYAAILMQLGDTKQAVKYQQKAVGEGENSEYNERYLKYLIANGNHEKAVLEAAGFIANNSASTKSREYYKQAYLKLNGSDIGFEEFLAQLERKGYEKARRDLQKKILNEEAPDFRLADLDGNEIILSSLKGKTVILDFWATWCKFCLDAFPGMQMAVDKHKNDENVVFLFVNTFERDKNINSKIRKLLEKNNYSFQVVLDRKKDDSIHYKTAKDYSVYGLPTKIIIGPDGKLRYKKAGESGNNKQLEQELGILIDLLKNYGESAS